MSGRLALVLAAALGLGAATTTAVERPLRAGTAPPATVSPALAAVIDGSAQLDPRLAALLPGRRRAELPYFVVLGEDKTALHRRVLERVGARILHDYETLDAFAVLSTPSAARRVAALPSVARLQPVELVHEAAEQEQDQTRATTADVGAPTAWGHGLTGRGVRIAVLDTGVDPTHPDLDDLDFRRWSTPLSPPKLVDARNFVGGGCQPLAGATDGHGHGTHVAGIATGTGEGTPLASDDGRYLGIAPDAELAVGKVLSDAGIGLNSDLIAALEWAAMPVGSRACAIGAHVVNLSLGSDSRPTRLNTSADVDLVGLTLNRLAVRYGTLFVAAAGNSGPYLGSVLEAPGTASQALTVAASAKDWDVNHDDTLSGDTCAGYQHPPSGANDCSAGVGTQPRSISAFSSRGPASDVWLKPDLSAPGYNIVSTQAATGAALAQNDVNGGTRLDPLYATATGTSMAAPAAAGSAAVVLQGYRDRHGTAPSGASGIDGFRAPTYALVRAALMNTANAGQYESRWILTTGTGTLLGCPPEPDPLLLSPCAFAEEFLGAIGSVSLYEVRNGATDPYVGPLAEGAGKLTIPGALAALRDGVVAYSAASGTGPDTGTGPHDLQGSWQIGAIRAGATATQRFVFHAAPGVDATVALSLEPGTPSDGSRAIPSSWKAKLSGGRIPVGGDRLATVSLQVPSGAEPGLYTGSLVARISNGQVLRLPVFVAVALHDADLGAGTGGPQARIASGVDVYAKGDTTWPSVVGTSGTGTSADWLVVPVELDGRLTSARFSVHDAAAGDETYDLYLYDARYDLVASTHPFAAPGVTDQAANGSRPASTSASPQVLTVPSPAAGRYYIAVSRARVGGTSSGDRGAFVLSLDAAGTRR